MRQSLRSTAACIEQLGVPASLSMWRPTNTIPFWLVVGLVFAIVWPPGAVIALAAVAYTIFRWIRQAGRAERSDSDDV